MRPHKDVPPLSQTPWQSPWLLGVGKVLLDWQMPTRPSDQPKKFGFVGWVAWCGRSVSKPPKSRIFCTNSTLSNLPKSRQIWKTNSERRRRTSGDWRRCGDSVRPQQRTTRQHTSERVPTARSGKLVGNFGEGNDGIECLESG